MSTARLMLFWDYDTQWGADRSRSGGGPKSWGNLDFVYTEDLLEIHAEYGLRACFAVVGAAALPGERPYHDPQQIRRVHAAGHEIASHAFRHEWLPALGPRELRASLRESKDALEQCIGSEVVSFVPPFNQPFDYAAALSFSMSERRQPRASRTSLAALCDALGECGYRFCRVAYRSLARRTWDWIRGERTDRPVSIERIGPIECARLNTPGGFGQDSMAMLNRVARAGGTVVAYGHPHSIRSGNSQDMRYLRPFLQQARSFVVRHRLSCELPRELVFKSSQ